MYQSSSFGRGDLWKYWLPFLAFVFAAVAFNKFKNHKVHIREVVSASVLGIFVATLRARSVVLFVQVARLAVSEHFEIDLHLHKATFDITQ